MNSEQILELLRQRQGGPGGMRALLEQATRDDPNLALLVELMERNGSVSALAEGEVDVDVEATPTPTAGDVESIRVGTQEIIAEVQRLRSFSDDLAAALGACPECWGTESGCRLCRGRGSPGCMPPDTGLFARWVAPALKAWLPRRPSLNPLGN